MAPYAGCAYAPPSPRAPPHRFAPFLMLAFTLFALDPGLAHALVQDPVAFAAAHALLFAPHDATVVAIASHTAARGVPDGSATPWGGYFALDGRRVVGAGGFKGDPDAEGAIEIAYFTFPGEEGRGVAAALAAALVARAQDPAIRVVRAHTLPEANASTRVLEKVGFRRTGDVIDPEDGPVWRWERAV